MSKILDLWRLARRVVDAYNNDRCMLLAAGLCYFVFFSVFPLLLLLVAVAGYFFSAAEAMDQATIFVAQLFPQQQQFLIDILRSVMEHRDQASLFGVVVLLWSAKNIFFTMGQALNMIWKIPRDRGPVIENAIAVGLSLSIGALIVLLTLAYAILTVIVSFRLPFLELAPGDVPGLAFLIANLLPLTLAALVLMALYMILPNRRLDWRQVLPGAVTAAVLWEAVRRVFGFYLDNLSRYELVYGSISGVVGFLFGIFVSANVFLLGAEVAKALTEPADGPAADATPETAVESA